MCSWLGNGVVRRGTEFVGWGCGVVGLVDMECMGVGEAGKACGSGGQVTVVWWVG